MRNTSKIVGVASESAALKLSNDTQSIIKLIKKMFPEEPVTACAVAYGESLNNPLGINHSDIEHSVGVMQINLMKPSTGKHIHWDKAQGNTLEEKTAWLQIPENNLKVARIIYEGAKINGVPIHKSFNQWSAYTNKSYLNHINKCKES